MECDHSRTGTVDGLPESGPRLDEETVDVVHGDTETLQSDVDVDLSDFDPSDRY